MYIPSATYRIQLFNQFKFKDLEKIVDYLDDLGISTIYASPMLQSRQGSTHGYDSVNPEAIDPEIGTYQEFQQLGQQLKQRNMGWLQDVVPNHMAFSPLNPWLNDVIEKGRRSRFHTYFDINWDHPNPDLQHKLLVPFLGSSLEEILSKGELKLVFETRGFTLKYFDNEYPVSVESYHQLMVLGKQFISEINASSDDDMEIYLGLMDEINEILQEPVFPDNRWEILKKELHEFYLKTLVFRGLIDKIIQRVNADKAQMKYLLDAQHFKLAHWQTTEQEINFRRFFTINDLICLQIEDPIVFEHYHRFLKKMYDEGLIQGIRLDHIDGLFNPGQYLRTLREQFGDDLYLTVEKILEWEEHLPAFWPIQGTTGYGFLATLSHFFTDWRNQDNFDQIYHQWIGDEPDYHQLVMDKKHFMLTQRMGGELNNLMMLMEWLNLWPAEESFNQKRVKEALAVFLVAHPVYRIYSTRYPLSQKSLSILRRTLDYAIVRKPDLKRELEFIFDLFTSTKADSQLALDNKMYFLMRCQQFTGPLEAKGVEDTTFYLFNRLISHNEVGDKPEIFGISHQEFHERMMERMALHPLSMNATATHDTKRGEDMRVRINVLSELPDEWKIQVNNWKEINKKFIKHKEKAIPAPNDEYFIYQTLVGAFPVDGKIDQTFSTRIKDYMIKVVREGKINSNWSDPNQIYEFGICDFIDRILEPNHDFLNAAQPFIQMVTQFGIIYSMAQTLMKVTCPGVPDVYQGCELWDLSLVDPDNRRPVDYELRKKMLEALKQQEFISFENLMDQKESGLVKFYTLYKSLQARRKHNDIFNQGKYIPLRFGGKHNWHAVGYIRQYRDQWMMVIIPRHLVLLINPGDFPLAEVWEDTYAILPAQGPNHWENIFTGEKTKNGDKFEIGEVLSRFPIALLYGQTTL
ncbi:MAG: malto-oligosyltrehalose synthase [Candidatus Cyclobacteriaceae bacterium M3_2C_046]